MHSAIKVGTWNVHGGRSREGQLLGEGYVERVVGDQSLDVVALQETELTSEGESLMFASESNVRTWPICPSDVSPDGRCGLSIVSRPGRTDLAKWRLARLTNPGLTREMDDSVWKSFDKAFVVGEVSCGSRSIVVVNLHFHAFRIFRRDPSEFPSLWEELARRIEVAAGSEPTVVMGDFNSEDRNLLLRYYRGSLTSLVAGKSTTPMGLSLDDILVSPHLTARDVRIVPTLSDHHLCSALLSMRPSL